MSSSRNRRRRARTAAYSEPVPSDLPRNHNRTERLEFIEVDVLRPWEQNARIHSPKQIRQVARSIETFGFTNPVLIDEENRSHRSRARKSGQAPQYETCAVSPARADEHDRETGLCDRR